MRKVFQDELVLNALAAVPREKFVDEAFEQKSTGQYRLADESGSRQFSQPYMVARMSRVLELAPQSRSAGNGTGSGYQTAIWHLVNMFALS